MNTKNVVLALAVLAMVTMQMTSADIIDNHYAFANCAEAQAAGDGSAGVYTLRHAGEVMVPCSQLQERFAFADNATVTCDGFTTCSDCANEATGECSWCPAGEGSCVNNIDTGCAETFIDDEGECPVEMCPVSFGEVVVYCDADGFQLATKFVQRVGASELQAGEASDIEADFYTAESNYYDDGSDVAPLSLAADWDAADGFTVESHSWLELLHGGNGLQDGSFYQLKVHTFKYAPPSTNATTQGVVSAEAETTITFAYDEAAALDGEPQSVHYVTVETKYTDGGFTVAYANGGRQLTLPAVETGFGFTTSVDGQQTDYFFPSFGAFGANEDIVAGAGSYGDSGDMMYTAVSIRAIQCNNDGSADAGEPAACPDVPVCQANGVCEATDNQEDCASCPADCGVCGNDICERFEYCYYDADTNTTDANGVGPTTNPAYSSACDDDEEGRCKGVCGDAYTDGVGADAEGCKSCPADYGECPVVCGDGDCVTGETCETCPDDCGACETEDPLQGSVDLSASGGLEVLAQQKKGDLLAVAGRYWGVLNGDVDGLDKRDHHGGDHGAPWYAIVDTGDNSATVQGLLGTGAAAAVAFAPGSDDSLQVGVQYDVLGTNAHPADARGPGAAFIETDDELDLDAAVFADLSKLAGEEWDMFDTHMVGVSNIGDHDTFAFEIVERVPPAINCTVWTDEHMYTFDGDDCNDKAAMCAELDVEACYLCGFPGTVLPSGVNCTAHYAVTEQMAARQAPLMEGGSEGASLFVFANVDFDSETASYASVWTPAGEELHVSSYADHDTLRLLTGTTTRTEALGFSTWTYDVQEGPEIPCECIFEEVDPTEETVDCPATNNGTATNETVAARELDDLQDLYEDEIFEREDGTCYILVDEPDVCSGFGAGGCTACNLADASSPIEGLDNCPRDGSVYTQVNNGTVSVEHTAAAGPTGFVVVFGKDGRALAALTYTDQDGYEVQSVSASAKGDTVTVTVTRGKEVEEEEETTVKRDGHVVVETQITIQSATGDFASGDASAIEDAGITQGDAIVLPTTSGMVTVVDSDEDATSTVVVGEFTETLAFDDADGNTAYSFTSDNDGDNQAGYLVVYDDAGIASFAEMISASSIGGQGGDVHVSGVSVVGANSYSVAGSFTGNLERPTFIAGHATEQRTFVVTLGAVPAKAPEAIDTLTFDYDAAPFTNWETTAAAQFVTTGYGSLAFTPAPFTRVGWTEPTTNGAAVTSYELQSETFSVPAFPNELVFGTLMSGAGTAGEADAESGKPTYYYDHALTTGATGDALEGGEEYNYRIRSASAAGTSLWSDEEERTTPTTPGAPINVAVLDDDAGFDRVRISWAAAPADPRAPVKGYIARVNDGEGGEVNGLSFEVFAADARSGYISGHGLTNGELIANTTYTIHLTAFNWYGEGPHRAVDASTLPPLPPTVPKRPFLQTATVDSLAVRWETVPDTGVAVTYTVQRAVQNGAFANWRTVTHDAVTPAASCQFTDAAHTFVDEDDTEVFIDLCEEVDTGLNARTFYRYRVGASNVEGFSGYGPFNRFRTSTQSEDATPVDATDDDNDKPAKTVIGITVGVGVAAVLVALFIHRTGERKYNNFFFLLIGVAAVALAVLIAWLVELLG